MLPIESCSKEVVDSAHLIYWDFASGTGGLQEIFFIETLREKDKVIYIDAYMDKLMRRRRGCIVRVDGSRVKARIIWAWGKSNVLEVCCDHVVPVVRQMMETI